MTAVNPIFPPPTPPPTPPIEPLNSLNVGLNKKPGPITKFLQLLVFSLALAFIGFSSYTIYQSLQEKQPSPSPIISQNLNPTPNPSLNPNPTAIASAIPTDWKTYTNNKYKYEIKYPKDYLAGYIDTIAGEFNESNGNEDQIDFLPSLNDEFNNFLQLQVTSKINGKTLTVFADDIYKKQKDHFQTTEIGNLTNSKFNGFASYEYTFSGQVLYTLSWDGMVIIGKYKVVIFEVGEKLYSLYLKDNDNFNQILSTFQFTN